MPPIVANLLRVGAEIVMKRRRAHLSFSRRFLRIGGYKWAYLDTAHKSTRNVLPYFHASSKQGPATSIQPIVVLVHGFSSDKDAWLPIAKYLVNMGYRVIIPDLPGHGAHLPNSQLRSRRPRTQATTNKFLSYHTTPSVHLVGYSMGGLIAGLFAATFPHLVRTLTLLCPAGISMPRPSPVVSLFDTTGRRLMEASTADEMNDLLRYSQGPTLKRQYSRVMVHAYAKIQAARKDIVGKIFDDLEPERSTLEDNLHRVEADTLVLWGKHDQILDVSCAYQVRRKGFRTIIVDGCGHDITQVRPQLCATHVIRMIQRYSKRSNDPKMSQTQITYTSLDSLGRSTLTFGSARRRPRRFSSSIRTRG
ncbi:hypothetical protein H310_12471 [Aphanomyces invadans]|uniref:AB hydrolase-1 domain-containing protein n=1 Tax=Aphanomyces invadans TaxID=157072 RepID=A0A024TK21_9STRA|nr:hypothetical protein H310_12471 [Aphanomyces invadans]ETV93707.1 hypothetical protein H310_12471 [Aphanomyces invadans]|eukprot:XP_008877748.1 hypothetical protein H310_12471 [Aphanomyces invadans]